MYCPKCGQSQASAEVRFCSRCGFPLVSVAELLSNGGMLPAYASSGEGVAVKPMSPRRRGVKRGAALLLISIFLFPFFAILHEAIGFPLEFIALGGIGAIAAILRIIFAAFFEEGAPRATHFIPQPPPQQFYAPPRMNAAAQEMLPPTPPQAQGTPTYRQPQVDTAQLLQPPSVTDHTTRLLDKQSDPSER